MSQDNMIVANGDGATVRAKINTGLQALASSSKGPSAPSTPYAGQFWIDDNTPSSTLWTLFCYDGTDWITVGQINSTGNTFIPIMATQSAGDNTTAGATTAFVQTATAKQAPGGRLSLSSSLPVHIADITAASTLNYLPYTNGTVPIYNGTNFLNYAIPSGMNMPLDSASGHTGYHQSGKLFDVFIFSNSGLPQLCTGPAWTNSTTRSAAISQVNGIWVNTSSMTFKVDASSFTGTLSANQGTYVGTFYATADGQTGVAFKPSAAAGGSNNIIGLWNAYNRVKASAVCRDSNASFTCSSGTWQVQDIAGTGSGLNNRISIIDGLGHTPIIAKSRIVLGTASAGSFAMIGVNQTATTGAPNLVGAMTGGTATLVNNYQMVSSEEEFYPALGFNYYQGMIAENGGATVTCNPSAAGQSHAVIVDTEY